ncbi:phosphoribosyl-AMP cyclohydrolase [Parvularcula marina]|uniref:phosphoribosyl-AMP cyclohydrolase n=1 Tax=Parvularcula marina TaxID=2292771 RepID=UPI0035194CAB
MADPRDETTAFTPKFGPDGLLPAIAVDAETGEVLMLAYMNEEALKRTLATGEVHYWSRSRAEIWHKGATSGNLQELAEILIDCDQDTLLLRVRQRGPACHTGRQSCFYRKLVTDDPESKELNGTVQLRFMDVE